MLKRIPGCQLNTTLIVSATILLVGCSAAYYGTMEKLGYHKRDLMVNRVESARDAQQEAKEQFESALEKFSSVVKVDGGELEEKYEQLKTAYDKSNARADTVRDRIEAVEDVSEALFDEWQAELDQYTSDSLRRSSARKLKQTRRQYRQIIGAMKRNSFEDSSRFSVISFMAAPHRSSTGQSPHEWPFPGRRCRPGGRGT